MMERLKGIRECISIRACRVNEERMKANGCMKERGTRKGNMQERRRREFFFFFVTRIFADKAGLFEMNEALYYTLIIAAQ